MTQPSDLAYFCLIDGDHIDLSAALTVGRHLDNDIVLSGEDVLDFHLRLEPGDRGPRAVPLGEGTVQINDVDFEQAAGLIPGDRVQVGQSEITLLARTLHPPEADGWLLHGERDAAGHPLHGVIRVGRGGDNDLALESGHVSRRHAELVCRDGVVFARDLGSANGTFVNGERISGGCRLFHGDEVRFDTQAFQLVGRGADLTPVLGLATDGQPLEPVRPSGPLRHNADITEVSVAPPHPALRPPTLPSGETGAFLLGASEPVTGLILRLPVGRTLIGRSDGCDLVLRDRTVSGQHAEVAVRSDGVTITNLMTTNGTRVNGEEVQTARLRDGDRLGLGRVTLVFRDAVPGEADRPWLRWLGLALLAGSLVLAGGLVLFLI